MTTLHILDVASGDVLGTITRQDSGEIVFSDGFAQDVFDGKLQAAQAAGFNEGDVFDAFATGWSNGSIQVPAIVGAR